MQQQNQDFKLKSIKDSGPFEVIDNSTHKSKNRRSQIKEQQNLKRSISAKPDLLTSKKKTIAENQKSKEDYPQNEIEQLQFRLIQMEISDFVIIEHNKNGQEYQVLNEIDWKKIIKQKNYNGFRMMDLHVSLLTQNLFFQERRDLWLFFCQVDKFKAQLNEKKLSYLQLQKKQNDFLTQIDKDIPRALQKNEFLKQQENRDSLRKVLTAYANYDPELGYTQGMNIIAANLLICYDLKSNDSALEDVEIIDPQRDENVFYIFSFIMIEQNWRSVFLPGFPGLTKMLKILNDKFQIELPSLYEHFKEINVDFNICFQQQYLSLLMYGLSWEISRMIFDLFLFEGEQIIHTFIIGMLQLCQDQLLKLNQFDEVLLFCRGEMIRQFYQLFSLQLNGKKDLTNTLHNLGIIKVQKELNYQQTVPIQEQQKKVGKMEQIKGAGKFIKKFFTRN